MSLDPRYLWVCLLIAFLMKHSQLTLNQPIKDTKPITKAFVSFLNMLVLHLVMTGELKIISKVMVMFHL